MRNALRNDVGCPNSEATLARTADAEAAERAGITYAEMMAPAARGM